jgi:Fe-S-cluster containining protein
MRALSSKQPAALEQKKKPLSVPPGAKKTHKKIHAVLLSLSRSTVRSCLEPEFTQTWNEALRLVDRYQQEIASAARVTMSCAAGCTACCCHWVEDVNSFEAEIIADYIRRRFSPDRVSGIAAQCRNDDRRLRSLNEIVETKINTMNPCLSKNAPDPVDLLLASFYQLQLPCPLLDANNGTCTAYPVRPLTCRMYVSFSDPSRCNPEYINADDIPTYLFDLEEEADSIIDTLHFKFLKFENDTGLRSLLLKYLL